MKAQFPVGTLLAWEEHSLLILAWDDWGCGPFDEELSALVLYKDGETRIRLGSTIKAISELPKVAVVLPADHQM